MFLFLFAGSLGTNHLHMYTDQLARRDSLRVWVLPSPQQLAMTIHVTSASQTLTKITQASQQVTTAVTDYSKRVKSAGNSRIRLQGQLESLVAACNIALGAINKSSSLSDDPNIRLVAWLSSDEPKICLHTSKDMNNLFKDETLSQQIFSTILFVREDKIQQAISLFNTRKTHSHLLLATDIW
ncbi:hypothetical protein BS17DRAFT_355918 [Gyrodon lividus]|nr:hypothetical protein BS17DRAFT_355918 [Gyrodon lividus]